MRGDERNKEQDVLGPLVRSQHLEPGPEAIRRPIDHRLARTSRSDRVNRSGTGPAADGAEIGGLPYGRVLPTVVDVIKTVGAILCLEHLQLGSFAQDAESSRRRSRRRTRRSGQRRLALFVPRRPLQEPACDPRHIVSLSISPPGRWQARTRRPGTRVLSGAA